MITQQGMTPERILRFRALDELSEDIAAILRNAAAARDEQSR